MRNDPRPWLIALIAAGAVIGEAGSAAVARPDDGDVCFGVDQPAPAPDERTVGTFDEETGRDLSNYPPHRRADVRHMRLEVDIPDMDVPRLSALETLTIRGVGRPLTTLSLDARLLEIEGVWWRGPGGLQRCPYDYDGSELAIRLTPPLAPGEEREIVTRYAVNDPREGLFWTLRSPEGSGVWPGRASQIHTQGEPETNSHWFPCHDFPNDRMTTEMIVSAPAGYLVSSNGRLVSHVSARSGEARGSDRTGDGSDGHAADAGFGSREVWHYLQDKPHVAYLVTLVVGKFDVVDVNTAAGAIGAVASSTRVPMPVYVPPGRGVDVKRTYGRTAAMADLFARLTGRAYPWDKYAQVVVWNFASGGMENTSATTMYDTAILSEAGAADGDLDGLISHELAHQWFGDLLTCNSWEHLWLNEGFATYFTHLWFEQRDGWDAYLAGVRGNFDGLAGDKAEAPYSVAMASREYGKPRDVFRKTANPYGKGAAVLHMLRMRLGDAAFFRAVQEYVRRFEFRTVETNDLRQVIEEVSGESLEQFFAQWCYRPGVPDLDVTTEWDSAAGQVVVHVAQKQNIDGYNPAFAFDLPVYIARGGGSGGATGIVRVDSKETTARFPAGGDPPRFVAVDPDMHVLAKMAVTQPREAWLAQMREGPTYAARVQAVRAPLNEGDEEVRAALISMAVSASENPSLRTEAVRAIREKCGAAVLIDLLAGGLDPVDVRSAAIDALGSSAAKIPADSSELRARCVGLLAAFAEEDPSERCRASAVRGLGKFKAADRMPLVLAALRTESQHDRIRQAAIDALADIDAPECLPEAIRCTSRGMPSRTRPDALSAVARLGRHDPDAAFRAIAGLLTDREPRTRSGAGRALVALGDPRGIAELEYEASRARDEAEKRRYEELAAEMRKKAAESGAGG